MVEKKVLNVPHTVVLAGGIRVTFPTGTIVEYEPDPDWRKPITSPVPEKPADSIVTLDTYYQEVFGVSPEGEDETNAGFMG